MPTTNDELSRLLKKLGYPDVQEATKPSGLLSRAIQAATKRLKRLEELVPSEVPTQPPEDPNAEPQEESLQTR